MKRKFIAALICLIIFALTLHNLHLFPGPWFDEGWTLSLARNWVVLGHYGHLLLGEPVPSTILNTGFPAIVPIALSFQLFGIGIWQGRLPSALFLIGVCLLAYHLAQRLYGRKIALWTLVGLVLLPRYPEIQPIFMGRQALGELPNLFFLLGGYSLLFAFWNRSNFMLLAAPILFALALQTKPQILPFWVVSLIIPIFWLIWRRQWAEVRYLSLSMATSFVLSILFALVAGCLLVPLGSQTASGNPYRMTSDWTVLLTYVIVLDPAYRLETLSALLISLTGLPVIIGLIYGGVRQIGFVVGSDQVKPQQIWQLILWAFVSSWFLWFFFLSIGFKRYLFPASSIGVIFAVKAFYDFTAGFNFAAVFRQLAQNLRRRQLDLKTVGAFFGLVLSLAFALGSLQWLALIAHPFEDSYAQVVDYLNGETAAAAVVETYDSELYLLLERDYHYPPDVVQHKLNRNLFLRENLLVDYDPTTVSIDYIVIGWSEMWPLYDDLLSGGTYELTYQNKGYRIYRNIVE